LDYAERSRNLLSILEHVYKSNEYDGVMLIGGRVVKKESKKKITHRTAHNTVSNKMTSTKMVSRKLYSFIEALRSTIRLLGGQAMRAVKH
jgi:hypothetical protein